MLDVHQLHFRRENFSLTVSFSLKAGRRLTIMGPSGSGKSTLLALLAGLETPLGGQRKWKTQSSPEASSILFQKHNLLPHLKVWQNVGLALGPSLRFSKEEKERIEEALGALHLQDFKERLPHELSGGEGQRVALARSCLQQKPLLLLDEPFNGLGPGMTYQILEDLFRLQEERGLTLILTTHNPMEALAFSSDLLFLDQGRIIERGHPADLFSSPHPQIRSYLGPTALGIASPIPCARVEADSLTN